MAKTSLIDKPPSPSPDRAKVKDINTSDKVVQKTTKK